MVFQRDPAETWGIECLAENLGVRTKPATGMGASGFSCLSCGGALDSVDTVLTLSHGKEKTNYEIYLIGCDHRTVSRYSASTRDTTSHDSTEGFYEKTNILWNYVYR